MNLYDEVSRQALGPRPLDFMLGAEAFDFLGGLALGFLASRVLRF